MKKLLISALMLLSTLTASAQMISAARDNQGVKFGVRASFASSSMTGKTADGSFDLLGIASSSVTSKNLSAFSAGVSMDLPILESFHFNIELKYAMKGQKTVQEAKVFNVNQEAIQFNRIGYVEVPIQPQFRLNFGEAHVNVNFGPYLAFAVHGHTKTKTHIEGQDDMISKFYTFTGKSFSHKEGSSRKWVDPADNYKAPYNRLDVGLAAGVAFEIAALHIGFNYDLGVRDIYEFARDVKDESWYEPTKNRTMYLTLGFNF